MKQGGISVVMVTIILGIIVIAIVVPIFGPKIINMVTEFMESPFGTTIQDESKEGLVVGEVGMTKVSLDSNNQVAMIQLVQLTLDCWRMFELSGWKDQICYEVKVSAISAGISEEEYLKELAYNKLGKDLAGEKGWKEVTWNIGYLTSGSKTFYICGDANTWPWLDIIQITRNPTEDCQ